MTDNKNHWQKITADEYIEEGTLLPTNVSMLGKHPVTIGHTTVKVKSLWYYIFKNLAKRQLGFPKNAHHND